NLAKSDNDLLAARAWTVLMRLGDGGRRNDVVAQTIAETRPTIRARALVTAGLGGSLTDEQAQAIVGKLDHAKPLERHATLFALGMAGSPELTALAGSPDPDTQRGVAWWLSQGAA